MPLNNPARDFASLRRPMRRLVPRSPERLSSRLLDRLTIVLAVAAGVLCLRVGSRYGLAPLLGLILPAVRCLASASYRLRVWAGLGVRLDEVRAFARGEGPTPWRSALVLVALPFLAFDLSNGKTLGAVDTRPVVPSAVRLVRHGDLDLTEYGRDGRRDLLFDPAGRLLPCYQRTPRGIYSAFPPGMLPAATVVAGSARLLGVNLEARPVFWRLEKLAAAVVASLVLGLFFLAALTFGSPGAAAVVTAWLATASAVYTTIGLGLWQHGGVAAWLLLILLLELRSRGRPTFRETLAQGAACGLMLTCRPTAALLVVGYGLWVFARSPRRALLTATSAVVAYLPCLILYRSTYGTILGPATIAMNASGSYWNLRPETLLGVLIGPARGLLVYQPWLVLGAIGLAWRRNAPAATRRTPGFPAFALAASAAHVALIAAWHDWSGGYCWGSRLLSEIIPLLGLACVRPVAGLMTSRAGRALIAAAGILGAMTHLPCVYRGADRWNYVTDHDRDLWSWSKAPFRHRN